MNMVDKLEDFDNLLVELEIGEDYFMKNEKYLSIKINSSFYLVLITCKFNNDELHDEP